MKNILTIILFSIGVTVIAQMAECPFNREDKISYSGVVDCPAKSKNQLYKDAKEYITRNYVSKDYPIFLDEVNEKIYVKGIFTVYFRKYYFPFFVNTTKYNEVYSLLLSFKDGKYKYELTDYKLQRKTDAKVNNINWGYGISTGSVTPSEVITKDLEPLYIYRYRKPFYKVFQHTEKESLAEVAKLTNYMATDQSSNNW